MFNKSPPPPENHAVYEIMWKNTVQPGRPQMTKWRMRISLWIHKSTNTHLEYVILVAFPLQQSLRQRPTVLRYIYTACLLSTDVLGHTGCALCRAT